MARGATTTARDVYADLLRDTRGLRREHANARDRWYANLPWDRKEESLFELEMLLKGFACFGNPRNHPGPIRTSPGVVHDHRPPRLDHPRDDAVGELPHGVGQRLGLAFQGEGQPLARGTGQLQAQADLDARLAARLGRDDFEPDEILAEAYKMRFKLPHLFLDDLRRALLAVPVEIAKCSDDFHAV